MPTLAELLLAAAGLAVLLAAYAYSRTSAAAATGAQTQTQMQKQTQTGLGPIEPLTGACARPPAQLRPFKPVYHITMGLKNATPSEWITIDADFAARLALRASLLAAKGRGVYGVVRGGEAAALELHRALHAYLPLRFPDVFSTKAGRLHNRATGASFPSASAVADPLAALQQIATTVEEDFFVLRQDADEQTGEHRCVAFVCCFPSGFDPAGKLGRGLAAIHAPVPSYARIGPSMERFFARVQVGRPVRRVNWAVQLGAELFNSGSNHIVGDEDEDVDVDPDAVDVADAHLRVEHQTLLRLPETRALVFSFKTYLYPLAQVRAEGLGPQLADAIEGLRAGNAPGMWTYKAAVRWGPKSVQYLRS